MACSAADLGGKIWVRDGKDLENIEKYLELIIISDVLHSQKLTSQRPFGSGLDVRHTLAPAHSQASQLLDTSASDLFRKGSAV